MQVRTSGDGGRTWSQPVMLGVRPAGPPLPTACVYRQQGRLLRVAAWSAQSSQSDGPLVIAIHDGTQWLPPVEHVAIRSSGASLHCTENGGAEIVWRDHRQGSNGPNVSLWMAHVSPAGALEDERDTHLAVSDDGLLWNEVDTDGAQAGLQPLDETGQYATVACAGQIVLATSGDWPTKADADARTETHRVGAAYSRDGGRTWFRVVPDGQGGGQRAMSTVAATDAAWVLWNEHGTVQLAEFR